MTPSGPALDIGGTRVGGGAPCYVIAEAGANHNRDLGLALELIDIAADAGAGAVKFQTYTGKDLYSSKTPRFEYLTDSRSPQELLDAIALPREWQAGLAEHARDRGIHFFSSPFDHAAVDSLAELGVPAMKIASFEIVDLGLIRKAASVGVPLVISTGMAVYGEIEDAINAAKQAGNSQVALLRCASVYPAPAEIMNLRSMATLRQAFGVPVGLSDHTLGIAVPTGAAGLGMDILEKHFTVSRDMEGPDHAFAVEPDELRAMIAAIRAVEAALGSGRIEGPSDLESQEMYRLARRSLVAACAISEGTQITEEMLTVKRPGFGIAPKHAELVTGRVARTDIEADEVMTWDMI